ncbi:MAG: hypothetical protein ACJ714_14035, partial [Ornithinibacter sp.]
AVSQPARALLSRVTFRARDVGSRGPVASLDLTCPRLGAQLLGRYEGAGVTVRGELTKDPLLQAELVLDPKCTRS